MAGAYDEKGRRKYLTKSEGERFLEATNRLKGRNRLLCRFLYFTGSRVTEAISMNLSRIDIETKEAVLRTLKKKDRNERRRIPLPDDLMKELLSQSAQTEKFWPISRSTVWRIVKDVMKDARIEGIHATCKGLRHSFAVRLTLENVPISEIRLLMGHSHIDTTAIYLAVKDAERRELVSRSW